MFGHEKSSYKTNGIALNPEVPTFGESVKIVYDGLLSRSGATEVYAHVGFGGNWTGANDFRMNRTTGGFEAVVPVSSPGTLSVAFKDCANNWDNNSGSNYVFSTHQ